MRGSQKSKLAAIAVFALIAIVVLGGISWATTATYQLAKKNVLDERNQRIRTAVSRMDTYVAGVVGHETRREYHEYNPEYATQAVAVHSADGVETGADTVLLSSPLSKLAPSDDDSIDLHFQVDKDGHASTPEMSSRGECHPRVCRTWFWLQGVLPNVDLAAQVVKGLSDDSADPPAAMRKRLVYRKTFKEFQTRQLPPRQCVAPNIAAWNMGEGRGWISETASRLEDVEVRTGRFAAPFWLEPRLPEEPKLAFVRDVTIDDEKVFQGFVLDWAHLKRILVKEIDDLFPDAELEPVNDNEEASSDVNLATVPVRLVVPDAAVTAGVAAWKSVRGTLTAMWIAAVAVLGVAGWGLRNLVNLTERRMQFAYAVTHELRTPLTTFRLYTDMLSAGLVPDESKQQYLETLNRESQRLSTLVEDVLEYSRLENQRVRLTPVDTDGSGLLNRLGEYFKKRCTDNNIEPRIENAMVNGDRIYTDVDVVNRITSVLVNNACRHTRGAKDPAVVLRLESENGRVHLDVIDTGPGIDRRDARVIFRPFRRGRKADAIAQGGIGLGLSLARNWATLLGGRLDLASNHHPKYGGAHFRLTIPREMKES